MLPSHAWLKQNLWRRSRCILVVHDILTQEPPGPMLHHSSHVVSKRRKKSHSVAISPLQRQNFPATQSPIPSLLVDSRIPHLALTMKRSRPSPSFVARSAQKKKKEKKRKSKSQPEYLHHARHGVHLPKQPCNPCTLCCVLASACVASPPWQQKRFFFKKNKIKPATSCTTY